MSHMAFAEYVGHVMKFVRPCADMLQVLVTQQCDSVKQYLATRDQICQEQRAAVRSIIVASAQLESVC